MKKLPYDVTMELAVPGEVFLFEAEPNSIVMELFYTASDHLEGGFPR